MSCFTNQKRITVEIGVILSDLEINVPLTVLIVEKYELFKCVAPIAANETKETMSEEEPPLQLGVVQYIVMCTPVVAKTVGRSTSKRLDKSVREKLPFKPILCPAFHVAYPFFKLHVLALLSMK
jgi:hypothetical protein